MPRAALKPGEWGNLHFTHLPDGRTRVHARCRGLDGQIQRVRVVGRNEADCRALLEEHSGVEVPKTDGDPPSALIPPDRPDLLRPSSTLFEMARCWLALEIEDGKVNDATGASLAGHIQKHIRATLGARRLDALDASSIDRHLLRARQASSTSVVRRTRSVLIRVLDLAVVWGLVVENHAKRTRPIRARGAQPLSLELGDVSAIFAALSGWAGDCDAADARDRGQLQLLLTVMLGTGLRLGEVLALRHASVRNAGTAVFVDATVTWSPSEGSHVAERLKRARQVRLLPLPPFAQRALADARSPGLDGGTLIFAEPDGRAMTANKARRLLAQFVAGDRLRASLPSLEGRSLTFRYIRSTVATQLAASVRIEDARDQLGHASIKTTERSYIARRLEVNSANGAALQEVFGGVV